MRKALADPFNCKGRYSDTSGQGCEELEFAVTDGPALARAYKIPSLRGVGQRAPYMHAGQYATLDEVADHYSRAPPAVDGKTEIEPLNLSADERRQIVAFLKTLDERKPLWGGLRVWPRAS